MKRFLLLGVGIVLSSCASLQFDSTCEDAAMVACSILKRHGYMTRIAIQETPWSSQGIYHAQCQAYDKGDWKWVVLETYPTAKWGWREYGEIVEVR